MNSSRLNNALSFANDEAHRFNHEFIGVEHLLLGLMREGIDYSDLLKNLKLRAIRLEVETLLPSGPEMIVMGRLPLTAEAKFVLSTASDEAKKYSEYVHPINVLWAILETRQNNVYQMLLKHYTDQQLSTEQWNLLQKSTIFSESESFINEINSIPPVRINTEENPEMSCNQIPSEMGKLEYLYDRAVQNGNDKEVQEIAKKMEALNGKSSLFDRAMIDLENALSKLVIAAVDKQEILKDIPTSRIKIDGALKLTSEFKYYKERIDAEK